MARERAGVARESGLKKKKIVKVAPVWLLATANPSLGERAGVPVVSDPTGLYSIVVCLAASF